MCWNNVALELEVCTGMVMVGIPQIPWEIAGIDTDVDLE